MVIKLFEHNMIAYKSAFENIYKTQDTDIRLQGLENSLLTLNLPRIIRTRVYCGSAYTKVTLKHK